MGKHRPQTLHGFFSSSPPSNPVRQVIFVHLLQRKRQRHNKSMATEIANDRARISTQKDPPTLLKHQIYNYSQRGLQPSTPAFFPIQQPGSNNLGGKCLTSKGPSKQKPLLPQGSSSQRSRSRGTLGPPCSGSQLEDPM